VTVTSGRLARNSLAGLLRYVVTAPIMLALTPFVLNELGPVQFGVWAIFGIITGYADLSDLGIESTLIRFVAQYQAADDDQAINRAVSTVVVLFLLTGTAVVTIGLLASRFVVSSVLQVPAGFTDEAVYVVTGAVVAFFVSLLSGAFGTVLQGRQRLDLWNGGLVLYTVLDAAGAVILLTRGYGLYALVLNRIFAVFATGVFNYILARKIMPALKLRPRFVSRQMAREIISYSLNIFVSKVATLAREPLSKTLMLRFSSLQGVTYFDLGARLANQTRGLFSAMLIPLLPASSGVQATGGSAATRRLFTRSTRYVILLTFPVFGGLFVFAGPIVSLWIGPGYEVVALTLKSLLVAFFFALATSPAYTILEGIGLARATAIASVIAAVLNVLLCIALGLGFGYLGVLAGYCISTIVLSLIIVVVFQRALVVSRAELSGAVPWRALAFCAIAAVLCGMALTRTNAQALWTVAAITAAYALLCLVGVLISGSIGKEEIRVIRGLLTVGTR
jgi:O-antigen/teichoic acid export membrane protein